MLNRVPPQLLMNLFNVDPRVYNEVMTNIQGKTPQQVHEYTVNLYKSQGKDIEQARQNIINRLNQSGFDFSRLNA